MSGKISENDERVARMKEMLSKGGGGIGGMPRIMPTKPKPKPKPKPAAAVANDQSEGNSANANSAHSSPSPDRHPDPITIVLNTDSLRDFSEKFDYDFDAVTRHQILDNSALLDRAALSQSKGLQNRRLPSNLASKVPDDYSTRRRAQTYVAPEGNMKRSATQPLSGSFKDEMDGGSTDVELTDEEKRQRNLAKLGIQQSNNPLSALGSILKRNSTGRGSLPRKSSKKLFDSPQSSPKTSKRPSMDSAVGMRFGSEPPESKSPKMGGGLFKGLRRSSSKSKKRNGDDDNRSETGSLLSLPIHSTLDEQSEEPVETKRKASPKALKKAITVPSSTPSTIASSVNEPISNGDRTPPKQVISQKVPLREGGSSSAASANRKTTDSAIFKEEAIESLFSSESLFDSSELDKLMGKKKEKTPERALDDTDSALAEKKKETTGEEKDKGVALKKSVSESAVKSNGYLAGKVLFPVSRTDRKRTADPSRKSIKDQLHRYESNSKVSKDEPLDTTPEIVVVSESPKEEAPETSEGKDVKEKKEIDVPTIVEEEEPQPPTAKEEAPKDEEVGTSEADDKVKSKEEELPPKKEEPAKKRAAGLFDNVADEDDDLFKKPTSSNKVDGDKEKSKKATLFSDDEEEEKPKEPSKTENKPKDDGEVVVDPLGATSEPKEETKKKGSLFDDIDLEEPPVYKVNIRSRRKAGRDQGEDKETPADDKKEKLADKTSTTAPKKDEEELFSSPKDTKKSSSLFDDIDMEEPPLFKVNIRSRRRLGKDPPPEETDDDLFGGGKSKQSADVSEAKPSSVEVKVESEDSSSATSIVDKEASKETETKAQDIIDGADDVSKKSPAKDLSPKTKKKEVPAKVAPKPAKKPTVATKPGAGSQGKPSWMAELKKRKQEKEGDAPSSPQKKKEEEIPEWRKRALEREKKKEAAKSMLGSKSPASARKSPQSPRKNDSERKSPATTRRRKSPTREATKPVEEVTLKKEDTDEVDGVDLETPEDAAAKDMEMKETMDSKDAEKKAEEKVETTVAKSPYKTRRQREREAKELEEKEQKEKDKPDDTSTTPVRSTYRTRREREREAREKEEKGTTEGVTMSPSRTDKEAKLGQKADAEERPRYKTRREREREAREKAEKEAKEKEENEVKAKVENKEKESKKGSESVEKSSKGDVADEDSYEARFKARRERAKANKGKEGKELPKVEDDSYEARYRARMERRAKEREQQKSGKESPMEGESGVESYKSRRNRNLEREQESASKEKEDKPGKENEDAKEEVKGESESSASSSTISVKDSPSRPPLKKKPSIEIISRKIRSGSRSSETASEDVKSPTSKESGGCDKKLNVDTDDDVFTRDGVKSPSHIEALRTTSPRLSVEMVTSRAESSKVHRDSDASADALDVKIDDFEKGILTSPLNRSAASSPKSSVSSERDLGEPRPYRSHTISTSRSPTPPGSGPLKLSDNVPEWKRKLMEKKRTSGSSPVHKTTPVKVEKASTEDKIPPWKKELLAKKKNRGDAKEDGPRPGRSVTISAGVTSSPKSSSRHSKTPAQTPDFMKEFQKKKSRGNQ